METRKYTFTHHIQNLDKCVRSIYTKTMKATQYITLAPTLDAGDPNELILKIRHVDVTFKRRR